IDSDTSKSSFEVHHQLVESYRQDFQKYAKKHQIKYLEQLFNQIPKMVGKQFQYHKIHGDYRKRELVPCLDLLCSANVIHKIVHSAGNGTPLGAEVNFERFKLIYLDVALCQAILGLDLNTWFLDPTAQFINRGHIAEAFVGQELLCYSNPTKHQDLFFWKREKRASIAEVDYIFDYKNEIKSIFTVDGLTMNEEDDKTKVIDLSNKDHTQVYKFEYLGYRFISGYNEKKHIPLILTISKRKRKRYADRLNKALDLYYSQSKGNEKNARKILMRRIRFLMGNTRLVNNKKNVLTGIYYVNSLINTTHDLKILDRYYNSVINKSSLPPPLKDRLKSYSFKESFNPSYITKFNAMELNTIMNNWKK
ncbi:hypothetical protein LCGC14_1695140, partial [marine sediment metagenome]